MLLKWIVVFNCVNQILLAKTYSHLRSMFVFIYIYSLSFLLPLAYKQHRECGGLNNNEVIAALVEAFLACQSISFTNFAPMSLSASGSLSVPPVFFRPRDFVFFLRYLHTHAPTIPFDLTPELLLDALLHNFNGTYHSQFQDLVSRNSRTLLLIRSNYCVGKVIFWQS